MIEDQGKLDWNVWRETIELNFDWKKGKEIDQSDGNEKCFNRTSEYPAEGTSSTSRDIS